MIRKDCYETGFPLCRRAPILCTTHQGEIMVAYNRFELKALLNRVDIASCAGVWPGKMNTDVFILDPKSYCQFVPPESDADIDSAESITLVIDEGDPRVEYVPGPHAQDKTTILSRDPTLYEYVLKSGIQHKVSMG